MKSVIHISRGVLINVLPKQTEGVKIYFVIYLNKIKTFELSGRHRPMYMYMLNYLQSLILLVSF
jgi:hypothetical protein